MKISNKAKLSAVFAMVLLMISAFVVMINAPVQAQELQDTGGIPLPPDVTPDESHDTYAHLSFRPNPVGVNQPILINMWMGPPIHVAHYFKDTFLVTLTKPDGDTVEIGPLSSYPGDATAWFEYNVDQVGTWKVKFDFLGRYYPAGDYFNLRNLRTTTFSSSLYYKPSSDGPYDLVVQDDQVISWPPSPLPTDYWTRPVSPMNREWWPILGSYPPTGVVGWEGPNWPANTNKYMSNYNFVPLVQGPNTSHIAWKRQLTIGGLIGGPTGQTTWSQPEMTRDAFPTIIYSGRAYDTYIKPGAGANRQTYWRCYDIRTGELYWERPLEPGEREPTFVEYGAQNEEVPGASARARITVRLVSIGGGRLIKYDPWTGTIDVNVTGPPSGVSSGDFYANPYVLSVQNLGGGNYRLINWTIENNAGNWLASSPGRVVVDNFTERIKGNITWPFSNLGYVDYEAGITVNRQGVSSPSTLTNVGERLRAASLNTGQVLWDITTDTTTGREIFFSSLTAVADHGKFAARMQDGKWYCWDLESGALEWKSEISGWPWGVFGAYSLVSAYGYIYSYDYVGIQAINWENGNIDWRFEAPTPFAYETPYQGNYSWHGAAKAADGKLYVYNSEHTPGDPMTRGWKLFCLDAITGDNIWNITTGQLVWNTIYFGLGGIPGSRWFQGAVADGYLAMTNEYDSYLYVYGKGKSETTVTAPDVEVAEGTAVLIKGTVIDMSPAQPETPCVSEESMTTQMEYLHMQMPIAGIKGDAILIGVPVTLSAVDESGNHHEIGTTTTNGYFGTFGHEWTPPDQGKYEIVATFAGDDSYGSSGASTFITVGPAPSQEEPQETEEPTAEAPFPTTEVAIIAAVAIVAVVTIGAYWALKRRK